MNQTQLEEQTIEAFKAHRKSSRTPIETYIEGHGWCHCDPTWKTCAHYRIKPTPKVIKVEGFWNGTQFSTGGFYGGTNFQKATATIEVIDNPKERREWKAYETPEGVLWSEREFMHMTQVDAALLGLKPIRVREVEKGGGE